MSTTTAPTMSAGACVFGRWVWNLRFSASALICFQKVCGGKGALGALQSVMVRVISEAGPAGLQGLSDETAALLVWAGQKWTEKDLSLDQVKRRLSDMHEVERRLLTVWAAADFLRATLELFEDKLAKVLPAATDSDPGLSPEALSQLRASLPALDELKTNLTSTASRVVARSESTETRR